MTSHPPLQEIVIKRSHIIGLSAALVVALAAGLAILKSPKAKAPAAPKKIEPAKPKHPKYPPLDTADYDRRLKILSHVSTTTVVAATPAVKTSTAPAKVAAWPPKTPYPKDGALLPFKRILAFYGNFHSERMGILGEFPEDEVLARLKTEVDRWAAADPHTPVLPAIHYVAVTAQGSPGGDGKYRLRMADKQIEKALAMAKKAGGVAFLDIQIGLSTVQAEVPRLDKYLQQPQVHLGLDPEFSMKDGTPPGRKIGTMDAAEINWAIHHLSKIVEDHGLPPKILVVHRFVAPMITNARLIKPTPQVQVVIDMDGWGTPDDKQKTYQLCVTKQPVQFAGFKIFYKNDLRKPGSRYLTPAEVLALKPSPIYVQYQ